MEIIALYVAAYVLGSIPFGVLIARLRGVDIMAVGSKNIGATNVARVLGKGPAACVFLLDVLKGAVPAMVAWLWLHSPEHATFVGVAAMMGHTMSPFLKFKGGKGVATGLGMLIGSAPLVAVCAFSTFLLLMAVCRIVSLASMVATFSILVFGFLFHAPIVVLAVYLVLVAYVMWRHRPNIARLLKGEEPKFRFGGAKPADAQAAVSTEEPKAETEADTTPCT